MSFRLFLSSQESISVGAGGDHYQDLAAVVDFVDSLGVRPVRLATDDWLALRDIAARIGTSRELVRLWAAGESGPGSFPPPLNPGRPMSFFSWAEVSVWLRDNTRHSPGPVTEPVAVAMNLALQLRRLLPRLRRPEAVLELFRP